MTSYLLDGDNVFLLLLFDVDFGTGSTKKGFFWLLLFNINGDGVCPTEIEVVILVNVGVDGVIIVVELVLPKDKSWVFLDNGVYNDEIILRIHQMFDYRNNIDEYYCFLNEYNRKTLIDEGYDNSLKNYLLYHYIYLNEQNLF